MVSPLLLVAFQFQTWAIIWLSPSNWWTTENVWIDNWIESGRLVRRNLDTSVAFLIQCSVWLSQRRTISWLSHRNPAANVMECQNCCFVCGSGTSFCEIIVAKYSWGIHGKACRCSWTNVPVFPCSSWGSCIFAIVAVSCSDALGPASEIWQSNIPLCFWIESEFFAVQPIMHNLQTKSHQNVILLDTGMWFLLMSIQNSE